MKQNVAVPFPKHFNFPPCSLKKKKKNTHSADCPGSPNTQCQTGTASNSGNEFKHHLVNLVKLVLMGKREFSLYQN